MEDTQEQKSDGYGSKSLWQWILLCVVIGAVVFGLIYYFVLAKKSRYNSSQTGNQYQNPTTQQITTAPSNSPSASGSQASITSQTTPSNSAAQQQNTVTLTATGWSPATLTIKAGETVKWINKSGQDATVNSDPHPTHTNYPPLNLGSFPDGGSLSLTFTKAGTYGYHNHYNPGEKGTITVQ